MLGEAWEVEDLLNNAKWTLWIEDELTEKIYKDLKNNNTFNLKLKAKFEI